MACWFVGLLACWPCALLTIMPPNPQTTTPDAHKTCLTPTRCESASLEQRTPRKAQNPNSRATPTPPPPWGCTGGRATPRGGGGRGCTEMRVSGILGLVSLPWRGWGSRRQQHDLATRCANNSRHRMRNNRRLQTCNVPLFETFGNFTSKGRSGRPLCRRALHRMRNSRHFQTLSDPFRPAMAQCSKHSSISNLQSTKGTILPRKNNFDTGPPARYIHPKWPMLAKSVAHFATLKAFWAKS